MDGRAIGVIEGGVLYFVRTDWIGRPSFAANAAGVKVWEAQYLPFGGVHTSTGLPIELRFPGQWYQAESGLHQNWMRDYDPTTGRYIQADPLGLVDGASVYNYALQNPGRYVDIMGLFVEDDPPGGGGDGPGECKSPDQCLIYRIFDGPGLESREYPIIFGKLCVYICYNPNEYKKQTYSMRYATCPATDFRFVLSPMSKDELTILGIGG